MPNFALQPTSAKGSTLPLESNSQEDICRHSITSFEGVKLVELWFRQPTTPQCATILSQETPRTEEELIEWLEKKSSCSLQHESELIGGLKMILLDSNKSFMREPRTIFNAIVKSFRIHHFFEEVASNPNEIFTSFTSVDQNSLGFVFRTPAIPDYAIAISYNFEERISYALVHGPPEGKISYQRLLEWLEYYKAMALNPLLLPLLATGLGTNRGRDMIAKCCDEAVGVERRTGQNHYEQKAQVELKESGLPELRLDAIKIICMCGIHEGRTKSRLLFLERAQQLFTERMFQIDRPESHQDYKEASSQLKDFIGYLESKNKNLLHKVRVAQLQAETQLSVILNIMAKNDFDRNITIAEQSKLTAERSQIIARLTKNDSAVIRDIAAASKQDSSSMKALAVLTMVFLPFTFLAALIEKPLDHPGTYFGVAFGVTAFVFVVLYTWFYCYEQPRKPRNLRERGAEVN